MKNLTLTKKQIEQLEKANKGKLSEIDIALMESKLAVDFLDCLLDDMATMKKDMKKEDRFYNKVMNIKKAN